MGRALFVCAIVLCAAASPGLAGTVVGDVIRTENRAAIESAMPQQDGRFGEPRDEVSEDERKRRRNDAKKVYKLGVQFGIEGRYVEAIDAFRRSISLDGTNPDAYFGLGHAYSDLGRWSEAAEALKQAVRLNPKDAEAYHRLGTAYFKGGRYEQSIAAFKEALLLKPKWADARYNIANAFFNMGRYEPAIVNYNDVLHFKPNLADIHNDLGVAYTELGRHAPATESFKRALDRNSDDAYAHNNLGLLYFQQGRQRDAVSHLKQAVRLAPNDDGIRDNFNLVSAGIERAAVGERVASSNSERVSVNDAGAGRGSGISTTRWRSRSSIVRIGELKELGTTEQIAVVSASLFSPRTISPDTTSERTPSTNAATNAAINVAPDISSERTAPPKPAPIKTASAPLPSVGSAVDGVMRTAPRTTGELSTIAPIDVDATPPTISKTEPAMPAAKESPGAVMTPNATTTTNAAAPVALTDIYRVGLGDVLDIRLLNSPTSASTLYTVLAGGLIEYPLAGDPVVVAGMTTDEIAARISTELRRRAVHDNPQVIASVREYSSHAVIVSGLVAEPGSKIIRREAIPLYVVLADAQPRPEAGRVVVASHATGTNSEIDLADTKALNALVHPGDVITVAARVPQFFFIGGQVNEPGQKSFHVGLTLTQAILASGGVLHTGSSSARVVGSVLTAGVVSSSSKSPVRITRQSSDGHLVTVEYNLRDIVSGQTPDPPVQPGDRIEVGK
ncbi:MAG: tetratricopeptide repeat protein [Pyrinomonadaceae bacterium]|nr:tetratricopeptide repeat protein [Pyrinomonadaceae bacterium]